MTSFYSLKYANLQEFDDALNGWDGSSFSNAKPILFNRYADTIRLFPTPDESATAGLKFLYNQIPADIVALTDPLSLPLVYHTVIFKYCLWQASMLDEDYDPAQLHKATFDEEMQTMAAFDNVAQSATYPVITVREEDM